MKNHVLYICSAYESGYGQPFRDLCNPYTEGSDEFDAYAYGKSESEDRNKDTVCNTCGGTGMYKTTNCPDCSPVLPVEEDQVKDCHTCKHHGSPRSPCLACTVQHRNGVDGVPSGWELKATPPNTGGE